MTINYVVEICIAVDIAILVFPIQLLWIKSQTLEKDTNPTICQFFLMKKLLKSGLSLEIKGLSYPSFSKYYI